MERLRCCVSVPYRGYSFFNCRNGMVRSLRAQFPSITGVIRFLIQEDNLVSVCDKVSVPYRGYSFFNCLKTVKRKSQKVSVPYRGYSFFNPTLKNPHDYLAQNAFCGAKLFLIGNR